MAESGQVLSHYEILRPLGKGGMGEVFLAEDTTLGRKVALKFLASEATRDPIARERFLREAKSAAVLDDPFICKVYETGEVDGELFIAMEYVEGEDLRTRLKRGPMDLEDAVKTAGEVAEALGVAHEFGIIHRDLKPANIMLTRQGHAKVLDFGLAKQVHFPGEMDTSAATVTSDDLTGLGTTLGTLAYMSPEQLCARPLNPRSDVFSFGVVLYEMLTGQHPFTRRTPAETVNAIIQDDIQPLVIEGQKVPGEVMSILDKALAKEPEERYLSASEMLEDIRTAERALVKPGKGISVKTGIAAAVSIAVLAAVVSWLVPRGQTPVVDAQPPDPISVLIADFENATGEEIFDGVLESATAIVLEDASFVQPYKRNQALKVANEIRPDVITLNEEMARLVAQREGVNIVVSGSISKSDGKYQLSMKALDPVSGEIVGQHELKPETRGDVLSGVGKLAGRTRESLGDTDPEKIRRAAEESFTATSLEAASAYVRAQDFLTAGKWQEAIDAFAELVEDHPDMGRAYSGIAVALANMGRREEAAEYYELAMAHIDRMTEREKGRTRGTYYLMTRNYEKASETYEQLVASYPYDEGARVNLVLGYFYGRQMERSLVAAQNAVDAFPHSAMARANHALVAMYASDFDTAVSQSEQVIADHPGYETAYVCLALSQVATGDLGTASVTYGSLAEISEWGASLAAAGLADIALFQGRAEDAAEILGKSSAIDLAGGNGAAAARKLTALAEAELLHGRSAKAADVARRALEASTQEPVLYEAALALVTAGDHDEALEIAIRLGEELAPEPRAYAKLVLGEIALAEGDPRRAANQFLEAQVILDTWIGRVCLGRAYVESGAFTEAHAELENALSRIGEAASVFCDDLPTFHYLPPVYYWLGRAQEGLGSPAASESYRTFLGIRGDGSPDPLAADARGRMAPD